VDSFVDPQISKFIGIESQIVTHARPSPAHDLLSTPQPSPSVGPDLLIHQILSGLGLAGQFEIG
jgi:hypothetical protein